VVAAELYLGLNQYGRGQLLRGGGGGRAAFTTGTTTTTKPQAQQQPPPPPPVDCSREEWFGVLDSLADSPPALYAMLTQHPALFLSHPE
jgi:hypothetical protein